MEATVMRPLVFAALAGLAFAPLEHLFPAHRRMRRSFRTDAIFATLGAITTRVGLVFGVGAILSGIDSLAPDRPLVPALRHHELPATFVGLGLFELGGYAYHRLAHAVPWMWRLHAVHHSSESMDWLASFRQHPLEIVLMTLAQNAPLVLLGIPFGAHATVLAVLKLNTIFVHSNLRVRIGLLRHLVATPSFHHRHHARSASPRNFATLFPFVDRLFGTASDEDASDFGVDEPMPTGFLGLVAHPFAPERRARGTGGPHHVAERISNSGLGLPTHASASATHARVAPR